MGHDHHFLSRLDRVRAEHVELALGLYRDAELVSHILAYSGVPESAPRIAISLGADRGPFVVVSRDGHFVTCLAEGMLPLSTPVVPRSRLDTIAGHVGQLQARMRAARRMAAGGAVFDLLESVVEAGDNVSREEMYGLFAVSPLLAPTLLESMAANARALHSSLHAILLTRELGPVQDALLHSYWKLSWANAHMALLCGIEIPEGYPDPLPVVEGQDPRAYLSALTLISGFSHCAIRGAWASSVAGSRVFGYYEQRYRKAIQTKDVVDSTLVLAALGLREPSLLADSLRVLRNMPGSEGPAAELWARHYRPVAGVFESVLNDPEMAVRKAEQAGREFVHLLGQSRPYGSAAHFVWPDEVPPSISLPMKAAIPAPILGRPLDVLEALTTLAWAVKVPGEELYPPREYRQALRDDWSPGKGRVVLDALRMSYPAPPPRHATRTPGPNQPCSCGSGKKYKKCCWKKTLA